MIKCDICCKRTSDYTKSVFDSPFSEKMSEVTLCQDCDKRLYGIGSLRYRHKHNIRRKVKK